MHKRAGIALAAAIAAAMSYTPVQAQQTSSVFTKSAKRVRISVSYSLRVPYDPDNAEASVKALEDGRKSMYRLIGGECTLLLSTIASSCHMTSASVRAKPGYQRRKRRYDSADQQSMDLNATAQLSIELKAAN